MNSCTAIAGPARGRPLRGAIAGALLAFAWLASACGQSASAATELRFEWRSGEGFAGDVSIHEAFPDQPQAETLMFREGDEPRLGPEIPGGVVHSEVGAVARVVVVVRNPTGEPLRFWVTPHLPQPYTAERGLVMHCLCTGQQYEITPRGMWTRVIEGGLSPQAGTRGPVVITHAFIAGEVPAPE
jgi:hypothetical protein